MSGKFKTLLEAFVEKDVELNESFEKIDTLFSKLADKNSGKEEIKLMQKYKSDLEDDLIEEDVEFDELDDDSLVYVLEQYLNKILNKDVKNIELIESKMTDTHLYVDTKIIIKSEEIPLTFILEALTQRDNGNLIFKLGRQLKEDFNTSSQYYFEGKLIDNKVYLESVYTQNNNLNENLELHDSIRQVNDAKSAYMKKCYYEFKDLDESFEITEENIDDFAVNKLATENCFSYNIFRNTLLNKGE